MYRPPTPIPSGKISGEEAAVHGLPKSFGINFDLDFCWTHFNWFSKKLDRFPFIRIKMNCKSSLAVWIEKMLMRSYFCQLKIFSSFSITLPRKNLSQITHKLAFLLLNCAKIFVLCDLPGVYLSLKPPFWKISSSNWIFNIIYYSLNVCTSHHGYHGKEKRTDIGISIIFGCVWILIRISASFMIIYQVESLI